ETEKGGVFLGRSAINPLTGETVPIFISDYVISSYGTGAIMNVPAHDARDFAFAKSAGLPIRQVIIPRDQQPEGPLERAFEDEGIVADSGPFTGMRSEEMRAKIGAYLRDRNIGRETIRYRLRDWSISRQRFWGCPIPMVRRQDGTWEPVPEQL